MDQKVKEQLEKKGTLYIVATPIGNLKDITIRAIESLKEVDLLLAEDTRNTKKLLNYLKLKKPTQSFYEHNEQKLIPEVLEKLKSGKKIALISDRGTPSISDPGSKLISAVLDEKINLVPIPGPSAVTTALSASGCPADRFIFLGFLPAQKSKRQKMLSDWKNCEETIVLFEAPHRILKTLKDILDIWGNREITLARELTKLFEEIKKTTVNDLIKEYNTNIPKGEITLIIKGEKAEPKEKINLEKIKKIVKKTLNSSKLPTPAIAELVSKKLGIKRNLVYKIILEIKKNNL